jgi:hypothetical protein
MPIIFISSSETYTEKIKRYGYEAHTINIQYYTPNPYRRTYYILPTNSLFIIENEYDYILTNNIFPNDNIEEDVKDYIKHLGTRNLMGKPYLPIGSSIILDINKNSLVIAPTMLLPQDVSKTENAYYATMAILYNILVNRLRAEELEDVDILFTPFCCDYGNMDEDESIKQILRGIKDYKNYKPIIFNLNTIIKEPNLYDQPKYYQNKQFFCINLNEI